MIYETLPCAGFCFFGITQQTRNTHAEKLVAFDAIPHQEYPLVRPFGEMLGQHHGRPCNRGRLERVRREAQYPLS